MFGRAHLDLLRVTVLHAVEIHPLLWRPEIASLTHQLCISNRAQVAQRRGTRKLTKNQSGITEERVLRGSSRGSRTYVLPILEISINNLSGTDGCRIIRKKVSVTGRHNGPVLFLNV
jgi:hypothetical protein